MSQVVEHEPLKRKRNAHEAQGHSDLIPRPVPPNVDTAPINYLPKNDAGKLRLIQGDYTTFQDTIDLLEDYESTLNNHESLALRLGAKLTGPRLLKALESAFDGPIRTSPTQSPYVRQVGWVDIVHFAKERPDEFVLNNERVCRFQLNGFNVEITEDDWRLIVSGAVDRVMPPQPLEQDETAELATVEIVELRLQNLIKKADEVAKRARQLNYNLIRRKHAIEKRRHHNGSSPPPHPTHSPQQGPSNGSRSPWYGHHRHAVSNKSYDLRADLLQQFESQSPTQSTYNQHHMGSYIPVQMHTLPPPPQPPQQTPQPPVQPPPQHQQSQQQPHHPMVQSAPLAPGPQLAPQHTQHTQHTQHNGSHVPTHNAQPSPQPIPQPPPQHAQQVPIVNFPSDPPVSRRPNSLPVSPKPTPVINHPPYVGNIGPPKNQNNNRLSVHSPVYRRLTPEITLDPANSDSETINREVIMARIERMEKGTAIVPQCDRCRRLKLNCVKHLTACQGCTKKHAKCAWKMVTDEEMAQVNKEQNGHSGNSQGPPSISLVVPTNTGHDDRLLSPMDQLTPGTVSRDDSTMGDDCSLAPGTPSSEHHRRGSDVHSRMDMDEAPSTNGNLSAPSNQGIKRGRSDSLQSRSPQPPMNRSPMAGQDTMLALADAALGAARCKGDTDGRSWMK